MPCVLLRGKSKKQASPVAMPKAASVERKPEREKPARLSNTEEDLQRRLVVYTTYCYVTVNLELTFCDVQLFYRQTQEFIFLR